MVYDVGMKTLDECELKVVKLRQQNIALEGIIRTQRKKLDSSPKNTQTLTEAIQTINSLYEVLVKERYKNTVLQDKIDHQERLLTFFCSGDNSKTTS